MDVKKNIAISVIYQVLKIIVPLITAPYVARVLGSGEIGIYSYTSSVAAYFSISAGLGTASYGAREIARNRNDKETVSRLFWEIEILTILTSAFVLLGWGIWIAFHTEYRVIYLILTFHILSITLDISWLYNGLEQFRYEIMINSAAKAAGVIFIFLFVRTQEDLAVYVLINSCSTFLGSASLWIYVRRFIIRTDMKHLSILPHLKKTAAYFLPSIAASIYTYLDKTLIGVFTLDNNENGFYEQAAKILNLSNSLAIVPVNSVIQSRNSFLFREKRTEEVKRNIELSMNGCMYMAAGICFGLWALAKDFVPVFFGAGYEPVIDILHIFAPIIILSGASAVYSSQYYTPAGKINSITKYTMIGSVLNFGLNIMLIPVLQARGAAISSVIAETVILIFYLENCSSYLTAIQLYGVLWKKVFAGTVMYMAIVLIKFKIMNSVMRLILGISAGFFVYTLILYIMRDEFVYGYIREQLLREQGGRYVK